MKTILVSGGNGKFANCLKNINIDYNLVLLSKKQMDITKTLDIDMAINKFKPNYFLHAGAMTRPLLKHELYPEDSILINIIGTSNIVRSCIKENIKLIYLSTDYVYPGITGNYKETDPILPFTNYGWSKLGGECAVQMYRNSLILRLAMIEYPFPHKKAFSNMIKSCIYNYGVAKIISKLLDYTGIINIGNTAQSIYNFVKVDNQNIQPSKCVQIIQLNTSMNTQRMKNAIS